MSISSTLLIYFMLSYVYVVNKHRCVQFIPLSFFVSVSQPSPSPLSLSLSLPLYLPSILFRCHLFSITFPPPLL
uniref:Uncharacterized protein n=1 Tax=Octopus bimaculoides TaxID=37653 RepID=A0A0L8FR41_OCTBM